VIFSVDGAMVAGDLNGSGVATTATSGLGSGPHTIIPGKRQHGLRG